MSKKHKNCILLGALLAHSTDPDDWPKSIRKVINKARLEMGEGLEAKQYALYEKSNIADIIFTKHGE